ncbi:HEXXH motif domain-containing protein [Lentzea sp. BCCO 10_0061]|uniref:HEXXH motif domain-containing protein n=1 Tax=Lentzea sokolovensis TaxID=3095429 RepID=A0ABU4UP79_9PSEU|nr:HEXXH motif domain-containing protein [Lentzea sp. BCCO 10_0061]MDX8141297.1 HEXXH motif domain-containing protein [Lentzea sp. BCCO 10_0061]
MLSPHRLPLHTVDQLARGGGDEAALRLLSDGQLSARLVALRTLLDEVSTRSSLLGLDEAWDLLTAAQRKSPSLVRDVLVQPQIGIWLADVLRALHGTMESAAPLWVEVGYLSCVAAAAAHRCDIDFALDVPVSRGVISLPSLGIATVQAAGPWALARAERRDGRLTLSCRGHTVRIPDDEHWSPVRRIGPPGFLPLLDDVDPRRDYRAPAPPHRLTDLDVARWDEGLNQAWALLSPEHANALSALVSTIVPVPSLPGGRPYSGSSADAFGAVLMSEPLDSTAFAEALTHEVQHTKLAGLDTMQPLCALGGNAYCYAPWRDDPRPVSGLLQGVYAFLGVTDFWRARRLVAASDRADFEFALWRSQTLHAARFLRNCPELTHLGRRFAAVMVARLSGWSNVEVGSEAGRAAWLAAQDHRATWRARHLTPDPMAVKELVEAWLHGQPRPLGAVPHPTLSPRPTSPLPRLELRRLWLRAPTEFTGRVQDVLATATAADVRHVAGDDEEAARLYVADIAARPDDVQAWIGLGLADPGTRALLLFPELVVAAHAEIAACTGEFPDPRALAAWAGGDRSAGG